MVTAKHHPCCSNYTWVFFGTPEGHFGFFSWGHLSEPNLNLNQTLGHLSEKGVFSFQIVVNSNTVCAKTEIAMTGLRLNKIIWELLKSDF